MANLPKDVLKKLQMIKELKGAIIDYSGQVAQLSLSVETYFKENDIKYAEAGEDSFTFTTPTSVVVDEKALANFLRKKKLYSEVFFPQTIAHLSRLEELVKLGKLTQEEIAAVSEIKENKSYIRFGKAKEKGLVDAVKEAKKKPR